VDNRIGEGQSGLPEPLYNRQAAGGPVDGPSRVIYVGTPSETCPVSLRFRTYRLIAENDAKGQVRTGAPQQRAPSIILWGGSQQRWCTLSPRFTVLWKFAATTLTPTRVLTIIFLP
jgi:hypothetical protein